MLAQALQSRAIQALKRYGASPWFALVTGGFAFAAALSVVVPFGGVLASCVLVAPKRWRAIAFCSAVGAAAGMLLLSLTFEHLGVRPLVEAYPDLVSSPEWIDARGWISRYGIVSLVAIAALPVPLTPALLFACIADLPLLQIAGAIWLGRWIKFHLYGWGTVELAEQWWKKTKT